MASLSFSTLNPLEQTKESAPCRLEKKGEDISRWASFLQKGLWSWRKGVQIPKLTQLSAIGLWVPLDIFVGL